MSRFFYSCGFFANVDSARRICVGVSSRLFGTVTFSIVVRIGECRKSKTATDTTLLRWYSIWTRRLASVFKRPYDSLDA
jgi:hypothetical protein